jgi:hypothetical protein
VVAGWSTNVGSNVGRPRSRIEVRNHAAVMAKDDEEVTDAAAWPGSQHTGAQVSLDSMGSRVNDARPSYSRVSSRSQRTIRPRSCSASCGPVMLMPAGVAKPSEMSRCPPRSAHSSRSLRLSSSG